MNLDELISSDSIQSYNEPNQSKIFVTSVSVPHSHIYKYSIKYFFLMSNPIWLEHFSKLLKLKTKRPQSIYWLPYRNIDSFFSFTPRYVYTLYVATNFIKWNDIIVYYVLYSRLIYVGGSAIAINIENVAR